MNTKNKVIAYMFYNAWVAELMYWGGFIVLMTCTFHLDSLLYFGAIVSGVVMHWGGLIKGGRLTEESLR